LTLRDIKDLGADPVDATLGLFVSHDNILNDVVVATPLGLVVFQGLNQGIFANSQPALSLGAEPVAVAGVDWNFDGYLDIAVLLPDNLAISYWNPDAQFFEPMTFFYASDPASSLGPVSPFSAPVDLVASDVDHDCRVDLLVLDRAAARVFVFRSTGQQAPGQAAPPAPIVVPTAAQPTQLATGRFNDDECEDLAVLNRAWGSFTIFLGAWCAGGAPVSCPDPSDWLP